MQLGRKGETYRPGVLLALLNYAPLILGDTRCVVGYKGCCLRIVLGDDGG